MPKTDHAHESSPKEVEPESAAERPERYAAALNVLSDDSSAVSDADEASEVRGRREEGK